MDSDMRTKAVGLFFGSFNPVHTGHVALAEYMLTHADLDEVWFVVSPQNPLKDERTLLPETDRLRMVELATADKKGLYASHVEFELPRPSYTFRTLTELATRYPQCQFSLIMGADNMACFHLWRNFREVLEGFRVLVYPRPGIDLAPLLVRYPQMVVVDAPIMPISSTQIRNEIAAGKHPIACLHPAVWALIEANGWYKN